MRARLTTTHTHEHTDSNNGRELGFFFFFPAFHLRSPFLLLSLSDTPDLQHASRHFILPLSPPRSFCAPKSNSISASGFFELLSAQK